MDNTTIGELLVTGVGERRDADDVRDVLQSVAWPEMSRGEYVFIEQLEVSGTLSELGDATRTAVQAAWSSASRTVHESAAVVRFADRAELLTHLTLDLVDQRTARRWYWREWRDLATRPGGEAVARLWAREPEWIASVVARLDAFGRLSEVWAIFSDHDTRHVLEALCAWLKVDAQTVMSPNDDSPHEGQPTPRRAMPGELRRWRSALAGISSDRPVARLAGLLSLVVSAPSALSRPGIARAVTVRSEELAPPSPEFTSMTDANEPRSAEGRQGDVVETARKNVERAEAEEGLATTSPDVPAFTTNFAGFVYVIAALQRVEFAHAITRHGLLDGRDHGWTIVELLAVSLGLDDDDPLAAWLRACRDDDDPPMDTTPLEQLALDLYGQELWNRALLCARGAVRISETHVDVELPLDGVRLDVRLAGLDVDPGWVAWLGRVVSIHYVGGLT